jgi:hypothetical protein
MFILTLMFGATGTFAVIAGIIGIIRGNIAEGIGAILVGSVAVVGFISMIRIWK